MEKMGNKLGFEILGGVIGWRSKKPQQRGLAFWPRLNFILATNGALTCFEFGLPEESKNNL